MKSLPRNRASSSSKFSLSRSRQCIVFYGAVSPPRSRQHKYARLGFEPGTHRSRGSYVTARVWPHVFGIRITVIYGHDREDIYVHRRIAIAPTIPRKFGNAALEDTGAHHSTTVLCEAHVRLHSPPPFGPQKNLHSNPCWGTHSPAPLDTFYPAVRAWMARSRHCCEPRTSFFV